MSVDFVPTSRERFRAELFVLSDEQLIEKGRLLRGLARNSLTVVSGRTALEEPDWPARLDDAIAEWRARYPKV